MKRRDGRFTLIDIKDWAWAKKEIAKRVVDFDLPQEYIKRCVAIFDEEEIQGIFLTCVFSGVKSFHGYKFITGSLDEQIDLCKKYIEEEKLEFSAYTTPQTKAILRRIGFSDFVVLNGIPIMRRQLCQQ